MKGFKFVSVFAILAIMFTSCTNSYSTGDRVGVITKFSKKGLMFDSWEGEMKVSPGIAQQQQMIGQYETFSFSIDNDKTIECTTHPDSIRLYMMRGEPVIIEYQETKGLNWFNNRGNTNYFIKSVKPIHPYVQTQFLKYHNIVEKIE